jgi:hypothetical protein
VSETRTHFRISRVITTQIPIIMMTRARAQSTAMAGKYRESSDGNGSVVGTEGAHFQRQPWLTALTMPHR